MQQLRFQQALATMQNCQFGQALWNPGSLREIYLVRIDARRFCNFLCPVMAGVTESIWVVQRENMLGRLVRDCQPAALPTVYVCFQEPVVWSVRSKPSALG